MWVYPQLYAGCVIIKSYQAGKQVKCLLWCSYGEVKCSRRPILMTNNSPK